MSESSRAMTGPRTISEMIPPLSANWNVVTNMWEPQTQGSFFSGNTTDSWRVLATVPSSLVYETSLDLSGYELDDLTIYPLFIGLQDPGVYSLSYGTTTRLRCLDIVSQERLELVETVDELMYFNSCPGMSPTKVDWTQILSGQFRLMIANTTFAAPSVMQTIQTGDFGSGEPSSVRKLWLYRFIIPSGTPAETSNLTVPASRFVIRANIVKEGDLEYLMRQKRSYELAGPVD